MNTRHPHSGSSRLVKILICLLFSGVLFSCSPPPMDVVISGKTMGTTYRVCASLPSGLSQNNLKEQITTRLDQINGVMSTYRKTSDISLFNNTRDVTPIPASRELVQVVVTAKNIWETTRGAFDPTVFPLVKLWGFGPGKTPEAPPDQETIRQIKARIGMDQVTAPSENHLQKKLPGLQIDLGAIAKGYGVDALARLMKEQGVKNGLVEIGGEITCWGHRPDGNPWRVGIALPQKNAAVNTLHSVISLSDQAMATSGDYRNFKVINGKVVTHIIDPRTGSPVKGGTVSASVIAPDCMTADGLATAMMVLGPDEGLKIISRLPDIHPLILTINPAGAYTEHVSPGFPAYTKPN